MAALIAPAFPIDIVATGIPLGIWTIDRRLSRPFNAELWMGTPITGKSVFILKSIKLEARYGIVIIISEEITPDAKNLTTSEKLL